VREKVESGTYSSASEVIHEALRFFAAAKNGGASIAGTDASSLDMLELQEARIDRAKSREAIDTLLRLRKGTKLGPGVTVRDLIDEGRR
jgi:Arc/MetJ-type ribon-helix-helix transcriptional regulator